MELGIIRRCNREDYGFIQQLHNNSDLFFHVKNVDHDSRMHHGLGMWLEGQLVAFIACPSKKHIGKQEATQIRLADELPDAKLLELKHTGVLDSPAVKTRLLPRKPEFYLHNIPAEYYPWFCHEPVRALFCKTFAAQKFLTSPVIALLDYLNSSNHITWSDDGWRTLSSLPFRNDEITAIFHAAIRKDISIKTLCILYTDIWTNEPDIISYIDINILLALKDHGWNPSEKQLAQLLPHLSNTQAIQFILENLPHETVLSNSMYIKAASETLLIKLLHSIDWTQTDPKSFQRFAPLLHNIEADLHPKASLVIVEGLVATDMLFSPWWPLLQESVQIRGLIYCSNFPEKFPHWRNDIRQITHQLAPNDDSLLLVVLQFFWIAYHHDNPPRQQELFFGAHQRLMRCIISDFNSQLSVTHALATLLPKCFDYSSKGTTYFCDARPWFNKNGIYCPEGQNHTYSRGLCNHFHGIDLTRTPYRDYLELKQLPAYELQSLVDFIHNLSIAETPQFRQLLKTEMRPHSTDYLTSDIKHDDLAEYPYRVAAYVNRLIDMRPHMRCRCGAWFRPDFTYAKLTTARLSTTVFNCVEGVGDEHDRSIYLNYCYRCHEAIIDSRECQQKDDYGYWLCMTCGGSKQFEKGSTCPVCRNTDTTYLSYRYGSRISCRKCNYNVRKY